VVSSLLVSALRDTYGPKVGYFKPIQTGLDSDTHTVAELTRIREFPEPAYFFAEPQAPYRAARNEGRQIELDTVVHYWNTLGAAHWVVEGAGGLLVPLSPKQTIRDLVKALNLNLLLVASTRLGTMNHTLLSVEAARSAGIQIAGLVLVGDRDPELVSILKEYTNISLIIEIPLFPSLSPEVVRERAREFFPPSCLEVLYGSKHS
jgi:dethiobiotin synthetase